MRSKKNNKLILILLLICFLLLLLWFSLNRTREGIKNPPPPPDNSVDLGQPCNNFRQCKGVRDGGDPGVQCIMDLDLKKPVCGLALKAGSSCTTSHDCISNCCYVRKPLSGSWPDSGKCFSNDIKNRKLLDNIIDNTMKNYDTAPGRCIK